MDPHARATTWQLVRDLRARGVTVLLTTHAMDEAEQLCDRVAIISGGKLAALGSPMELTRTAVADEIWFSATAGIETGVLAKVLDVDENDVVESSEGEYVVRAPGTPARVADLACYLRDHDLALYALQTGRRSLEEVFLRITAEEPR
jgi:ABC-2 type transport system ATP-binding protein